MYQIKLEQFEGPLDLLMNLIEEQKLDITRVSLAKVADQFLEFIGNREHMTLENMANFLSVASRLILIKSKALLPMLEFSEEEEIEIKDLEWQLKEYKKFKDIVGRIGTIFSAPRFSATREGFQGMHSFFYPPENINAYDLKKAYLKVLSEIPILEKIEREMVQEVITLEEKINQLQNHLRIRVETSFAEIVADAKDKIDVIVSFLAMLEMVKQRIINVDQDELFSEIRLRHKEEIISQ